MKNKTHNYLLGYKHPDCRIYKPKMNKKRQLLLGGLVLGDIILPMTFGAGIMITKLITKFRPLYLYR